MKSVSVRSLFALIVGFVVLLVMPWHAGALGSCVELQHDMALEDTDANTGGDVSRLQNFLEREVDIYTGNDRDPKGYYGIATKFAVYKWQKTHGMKVASSGAWGVVDASTRAAMAVCKRALTVPKGTTAVYGTADFSVGGCAPLTKSLSRGSYGTEVVILQKFLVSRYPDFDSSNVTGLFGPKTEAMLQRWQADEDVIASGSPGTTGYGATGPLTRSRIAKACSTPPASASSEPSPARSVTHEEPAVTCAGTPAVCAEGYRPSGLCNLQCIPEPATRSPFISYYVDGTPVQQDHPIGSSYYPPSAPPDIGVSQQVSGESSATMRVSQAGEHTVDFSGTYNINSDCDAQFELDFGDGETMRFSPSCAPTPYSVTYTYPDPDVYDAYISEITSTEGGDVHYATQSEALITIEENGSVLIEVIELFSSGNTGTYAALAAALVALDSLLNSIVGDLLSRTPWHQ